ncbi:hypothetical protein [Haloprofundus salilacus]|uniref:hypothetical protein n=1 Tax=Haloprofundus salilacus TaxID=2876190 RepID=UPI003CCCDD85
MRPEASLASAAVEGMPVDAGCVGETDGAESGVNETDADGTGVDETGVGDATPAQTASRQRTTAIPRRTTRSGPVSADKRSLRCFFGSDRR